MRCSTQPGEWWISVAIFYGLKYVGIDLAFAPAYTSLKEKYNDANFMAFLKSLTMLECTAILLQT